MTAVPTTKAPRSEILACTLKINEIFHSIQGESTLTGLPSVFIRLTGCPLRCSYCDTEYAFHEGGKITLGGILQSVSEYRTPHVMVTGGEPLAQKNCFLLLGLLCDEGYRVALETSGAMDISEVDRRVKIILDLKTPGSGEERKNDYENIPRLGNSDEVKFVLCNRDDYDWAVAKLQNFRLQDRCEILFSPSHDQLEGRKLAEWVLEDRLPVRVQIQLHKYLWGNERGR